MRNDGRQRCGFAAALTDVREVHALHRSAPRPEPALRAGSGRGAIPVSGFRSGFRFRFRFQFQFFSIFYDFFNPKNVLNMFLVEFFMEKKIPKIL